MRNGKPIVGFDRYVEKAWMDYTAQLAVDNVPLSDAIDLLDNYLLASIDGVCSRRNTRSILAATWFKTGEVDFMFKKEAISLFACADSSERLAIHYGISVATYPFFLSLGKILGRLFKLQDEITNAEFYRRVIESRGDSESIKRAAARYLQSLMEWGIIEQAGKARVRPGSRIQLCNPELITWLYSAILFSSDRERLLVDDIISEPVWFPFEIPYGNFNYSDSNLIEVVHQCIGESLIDIRKVF